MSFWHRIVPKWLDDILPSWGMIFAIFFGAIASELGIIIHLPTFLFIIGLFICLKIIDILELKYRKEEQPEIIEENKET